MGASPPLVFRLAADPLRWALLEELARSDRTVAELMKRTGEPQSLVSYHLGQLRSAGLVIGRRSSHDRRQLYYRVDLGRFEGELAAAGTALHPGVAIRTRSPGALFGPFNPGRVLFVCTENSARSQMAEAFVRELSGGSVGALSAGLAPGHVHPAAVSAMARRGIDISAQRAKGIGEFLGQDFDVVVSVCDRAREQLPGGVRAATFVHWSLEDPAVAPGSPQMEETFDATAAELATRSRWFLRGRAA